MGSELDKWVRRFDPAFQVASRPGRGRRSPERREGTLELLRPLADLHRIATRFLAIATTETPEAGEIDDLNTRLIAFKRVEISVPYLSVGIVNGKKQTYILGHDRKHSLHARILAELEDAFSKNNIAVCGQCGHPFIYARAQRKYCSYRCGTRAAMRSQRQRLKEAPRGLPYSEVLAELYKETQSTRKSDSIPEPTGNTNRGPR